MRPVDSLSRLSGLCDARLGQLQALVDVVPRQPRRADDRVIAYAAIEALNLWALFVRSFYLSCVFNARRSNGARVAHGYPRVSRSQAIDVAVQTATPVLASRRK